MSRKIYPGRPYPLGATWDGKGVNFTLFADNADAVDLCLFDSPEPDAREEVIRITQRSHHIWHIYLPDMAPGQLYGFRVHGPYEPDRGHRFNAHKLLLDPYAKGIAGAINWHDALFGYVVGDPQADLSFSKLDSASYLPKSVVIDPSF